MNETDRGDDYAGFWTDRYDERDQVWSGDPNAALVTLVSAWRPGRALDLGCGEGGDSVWLAERGWRVTAVDVAVNAIARGRALAERRGVAESIAWHVADLRSWQPPESYDLVSAFFLHSPVDFPRRTVLRRAAAAVTPGGHMLIVGHAEPPPWAAAHGHLERALPTPAEEIADLQLHGAEWETVIAEIRSRPARGPDGEEAILRDSVTLVRRCPRQDSNLRRTV